tara:strand:+ start:2881 stop:4014 length:1134 start_codon:yes stop_codon:yes gene_type:complete
MKSDKIIGPKAYINLDRCRSNLLAIQKSIGDKKLLCVVKANGYGHGSIQIAKAIANVRNVKFAVFSFDEALELRSAKIKNEILVFSKLQKNNIELAYKENVTLNISSFDDIEHVDSFYLRNKVSPKYHLKFDTGMTRLGFDIEDAEAVCKSLSKSLGPFIEGVYTHFATADEGDLSYAEKQLNDFKIVIKKVENFGLKFKFIHCSNSGAVLNLEESYFNMVRVGMLLYGALPSNEVYDNIGIRPIMSFCGSIVNVRSVKKDTPVSYGGVYKTVSDTNIAVIQTGFADGFPRPWFDKGYVIYNGQKFKIAGRVCMDQLMIDFGNVVPKIGDDVLFFGDNEIGNLPVEIIADQINSTPYVLFTAIGGRTKSIYINKNKF